MELFITTARACSSWLLWVSYTPTESSEVTNSGYISQVLEYNQMGIIMHNIYSLYSLR